VAVCVAVWFAATGTTNIGKTSCVVGSDQVRAEVQPTRLLELPDYALETRIKITNFSPCELHLVAVKANIKTATLLDGSVYSVGADDAQSFSVVLRPGQQVDLTYVFPPIDRKPASLSVKITLGFEGQGDIQVFEGQIKVP
jgi:hypothetical protein